MRAMTQLMRVCAHALLIPRLGPGDSGRESGAKANVNFSKESQRAKHIDLGQTATALVALELTQGRVAALRACLAWCAQLWTPRAACAVTIWSPRSLLCASTDFDYGDFIKLTHGAPRSSRPWQVARRRLGLTFTRPIG